MSLAAYQKKRDFRKTPEPEGKPEGGEGRRFVVQKHAASRLHYDFRLEIGGTLKSWAVPKGIPFAKGEKRLAVQVEDHPVSYIHFEGTIPQGQYGGGTVMVWDTGTFEPLSAAPAKELAGGKLHFVLKGKKLKGEWYLVRLREGDQWLLIRGGADLKPVSAKADDESVLSGKTMKALGESDQVWTKAGAVTKTPAAPKPAPRKKVSKKRAAPGPAFVEPMKAQLVESAPAGDWFYEIKFDGFRALALRGGDALELLSRNKKSLAAKFPEVVDAVAALELDDAIIDGEIVALDPMGRSSFQLLQAYELGQERPPIIFYAFDLLQLDGERLIGLPVEERKARLEKLLARASGAIRYSASLGGDAAKLLKQAQKLGLEGLIGKRAGSLYEIGRRSGAWIKLKLHQEQEFVIGGYTPPGGSRSHFGALLIGVYEGKKLVFTGKVGTGFNTALLRTLHARFRKIARESCPFSNLPQSRKSRFGQTITASVMKTCHWVEPTLVCQIKFSEWTRDGSLRQPVFLGLREDKPASEVIREKTK